MTPRRECNRWVERRSALLEYRTETFGWPLYEQSRHWSSVPSGKLGNALDWAAFLLLCTITSGTLMAAPQLQGIHHLKLAVSDLAVSLDFYQRAFDAHRIPNADHRRESDGTLYAYILDVPGLGAHLELRLNPARATANARFDPVTIAVADRSTLAEWDAHLSVQKIAHSPIITAIQAWLIVVEDPDGNRIRLYTRETHGSELKPDEDNDWLQN